MQTQWQPLMPQQFAAPLEGGNYFNGGQDYESGPSGSGNLDSISRFLQQTGEAGGEMMPFSALGMFNLGQGDEQSGGFFGQMGSWMQQAGNAISGWMSGTPNYGNEQYFSSASGGSNGDPHISFNGGTWNDMQSEPNLLNSDSIHGGYQLSTQTTPPNANGVTYNQSATVTTHGGNTAVTLNNNGNATITQNGVTQNLAPGQTVQLGNETITCNQNGSLQITSQNQSGGQITTTMTQNGQGVDVNVSANNVDLGGAMVNGSSGCQSQAPQPPTRHDPDPIRPIGMEPLDNNSFV
jgi:hypothetical protein